MTKMESQSLAMTPIRKPVVIVDSSLPVRLQLLGNDLRPRRLGSDRGLFAGRSAPYQEQSRASGSRPAQGS